MTDGKELFWLSKRHNVYKKVPYYVQTPEQNWAASLIPVSVSAGKQQN